MPMEREPVERSCLGPAIEIVAHIGWRYVYASLLAACQSIACVHGRYERQAQDPRT